MKWCGVVCLCLCLCLCVFLVCVCVCGFDVTLTVCVCVRGTCPLAPSLGDARHPGRLLRSASANPPRPRGKGPPSLHLCAGLDLKTKTYGSLVKSFTPSVRATTAVCLLCGAADTLFQCTANLRPTPSHVMPCTKHRKATGH